MVKRTWWPFWRQERHQSSDNHKAILSDETSFSKQILDGLGRGDDEIEISISTEPHYSEDKDIAHIRQSETWDCGLTCIQMILQWLRESNNNNEDKEHINADNECKAAIADRLQLEKNWLVEYVATESIWTIDLVILLQHIISEGINRSNEEEEHSSTTINQIEQYTLSYLFCSTKFGVDKTYNNIGYYKDTFTSDEIRVNNLFDIAEKQVLPLLETSTNLTLQVLANVVSRKGIVAIVLLDNRILKNESNEASTYCGHYVILCGISRDSNDIRCAQVNAEEEVQNDSLQFDFCLVLKNPGIYKQVEYVSPYVFDKARKAKGTDQDVIFIAT